jgi:molybdate transport system substrate-binding protein
MSKHGKYAIFRPLLVVLLLLSGPAIAAAEEITVMTSGGFTAALATLSDVYEKQSGNKLIVIHGPSMGEDPTAIPARLTRGETADVVILARGGLDKLVTKGQVVAGSETDLGLGYIVMAVKAGAQKPDISSVDAFRRTLLAAKSVAYSDSASGVYLSTELFKRLGIDKELAAKGKMIQATPVGLNVARGEFELGFQQMSEMKPVPGIDIVGPIPQDVQQITPFSAGIVAASKNPARAKELIRFLASSDAFPAIRASGMIPAQEKAR